MGLTVLFVIAGLLVGLVRGGSVRALADRPVHDVALLAVGAGCVVAAEVLDHEGASPLLLAGFVGLVAFALSNVALAGMGVVLVGLLLNVFVVTLNDGMPVRASALVGADLATWDEVVSIDLGARRHLATNDDRLTVLGDAIPVPALRQVVSFGDLVLGVGLAAATTNLLLGRRAERPKHARRRRWLLVGTAP